MVQVRKMDVAELLFLRKAAELPGSLVAKMESMVTFPEERQSPRRSDCAQRSSDCLQKDTCSRSKKLQNRSSWTSLPTCCYLPHLWQLYQVLDLEL